MNYLLIILVLFSILCLVLALSACFINSKLYHENEKIILSIYDIRNECLTYLQKIKDEPNKEK